MKKLILLSFLLLGFGVFGQGEDLFEAANTAYQNGNYEEAAAKYEEILENGEASAEVYYNLGNSYYKLNRVAPSIYHYEKALQLDPGDEDIRNNIEFARNMAIDDIEAVEQTGIDRWFNDLIAVFSYNTWAVLSIVFSVVFVVLFLLYYFSATPLYKRLLFGGAMAMLIFSLVSVIFAFQQESYIENNQYAIIFAEETEVRDEPNLRGESSFELHEGTKARILENYQEWSKIELANGAQGWIKTEDVRKL
ncbi:tetratricopeptide repeat protein [Gramella sp. GC03-9]|uniref:Tetratricopeptide repeat protein n=1 Tax=Christiangramia oceanisediminis TaxID=2920386 RepID=A0A9X2KW81_9FLAO|nr:tetratricopeptide repeat protein [Gramella oceanisediminis]MCP9199168.1 tetratricopeptide repeat protein [Gramella oceanisediminis]